MDFVERLSGLAGGSRPAGSAKLFDMSHLSPAVVAHLQQVYITLAVAMALAAAGVWASAATGFGQGLGMLGFLVCVPWMLATPARPDTLRKRRALFAGAALSQGLLLAPVVRAALALNPAVLFTAFGGTAAAFACFSAAALLSPRRSYLYLGGVLGTAVTTLLWMRLATWAFGGAALLLQAELYGGLLMFSGYIVYDTQVIVERCEAGDRDSLRHALDLFVDAAAIFVRLLVVLMRNAQERQRKEQEGPQRRRRDARTSRL